MQSLKMFYITATQRRVCVNTAGALGATEPSMIASFYTQTHFYSMSPGHFHILDSLQRRKRDNCIDFRAKTKVTEIECVCV